MKGFNKGWIDGTTSVKKDSLEKHMKGEPHKYAKQLHLQEALGSATYQEKVVSPSPIFSGITKLKDADREVRFFP